MPTSISHYEMLEKLGEGGMGVVWKARDTHLERYVALKLLPAGKTADPARRQRFIREARAASALNHPNIVIIHDIDCSNGTDFIAMEFVAGKTLDHLIPKKGLRVSEALKYAIQIVDALAAAHAVGIVHRDLKPGNVVVSEKGVVKVVDFGLAKLIEDTNPSAAESTRTIKPENSTTEGVIVGTASYMSPEQVEGKKVGPSSDIFSFGALLYEMLTGRRAFHGESKFHTLAAIVSTDPGLLDKYARDLPRELIRLVERCLRERTGSRTHSMQDLRLALKELKQDLDSGVLVPQKAAPRKLNRMLALAGASTLIFAIAAGAIWSYLKPAPKVSLESVPLTSFPGYEGAPAFSPDGNQIAFTWNGDNGDNDDIYVQLMGFGRPLRLTTDSDPDAFPRFSPDGHSIAFLRKSSGQWKLMSIPAWGAGNARSQRWVNSRG